MNSLKKKFGKFAVSFEKMAKINGGHCPKSLQTKQGCKDYWENDTQGAQACIDNCAKDKLIEF